MKYKFRFELEDRDGFVFEYDTDLEPFRIGELVNLGELTNDKKLDDIFRVIEVWRNPLTPHKESILFTLREYKP